MMQNMHQVAVFPFNYPSIKGYGVSVVFVDSLASYPRKAYNEIIKEVEATYFKRQAFEPYEEIKYFDFWRLYYTVFHGHKIYLF